MVRNLFWLDDAAWSSIEPLLPKNQPGARRVDDRRIISGIIHVLQADLDAWLRHYNHERPHLGYRNQGRRPWETVEKFVNQTARQEG